MKLKKKQSAVVRKQYTPQFKEQALELAEKSGVVKAAADLGIAEAMLYAWRGKRRQTGQPFEEQKLQQAELARLKRENARLGDEVAFLKKAAAYFAKQPQRSTP